MSSTSPPYAPDRRQISLVRCGDSSSQNITLDEWISDFEPLAPGHTLVLHECILLARRMVLTAVGAQVTAQVLFESWISSQVQSPEDSEPHLAEAVTEVQNFESAHAMTLIVDNSVRECTELERSDSMRLKLKFDLAQVAAEAEAQSLATGASLESRMRRHLQVFFIAVVIANATQQAIRRATSKSDPYPDINRLDTDASYHCGNSSHWTDRIDPKLRPDAGGWRFEELMFGGPVARQKAISQRFDTDRLPGGTSGLVVMMSQDGVSGYRTIPDNIIKLIVEESNGWERYLPLNQESLDDFVAGAPSNGVYRTGDGSKNLYWVKMSRPIGFVGLPYHGPPL